MRAITETLTAAVRDGLIAGTDILVLLSNPNGQVTHGRHTA